MKEKELNGKGVNTAGSYNGRAREVVMVVCGHGQQRVPQAKEKGGKEDEK